MVCGCLEFKNFVKYLSKKLCTIKNKCFENISSNLFKTLYEPSLSKNPMYTSKTDKYPGISLRASPVVVVI